MGKIRDWLLNGLFTQSYLMNEESLASASPYNRSNRANPTSATWQLRRWLASEDAPVPCGFQEYPWSRT
ncbi:MAG: hypothetical protein O2931_14800 [Planctomycetota bacterium]|nr:hypothetical protein [Planctomycetota bacterium]MDA1180051.1 hypothetical protein [Planctomycetota bacterium]